MGSSDDGLFANHDFARLFSAQVTSLVGSGVTSVALAAFAYELTGSNATEVVGLALMLRILAFLLFSQPAGVLADRVHRRRMLVTADLVRVALLGLFPFITAVWQIYGLIFAINAVTAFFTGSYTLAAQTILPSTTLPSHTSMLTGVGPSTHGITWDDNETDSRGMVKVPTIFAEAHEQGLKTAAFISKGKFEHLELPNTLDHAEAPAGNAKWPAERTVENVQQYLRTEKPDLMFVHFGEPDYAGHKFSWMSWFYGRAVRQADEAVGEVLAAADRAFGEGQYTVILTADHGGHGWGHGSAAARDVTIPWIARGQGVEVGTRLKAQVRTVDTAATAIWLLGVRPEGTGSPVRTAFETGDVPQLAGAAPAPPPGEERPDQPAPR